MSHLWMQNLRRYPQDCRHLIRFTLIPALERTVLNTLLASLPLILKRAYSGRLLFLFFSEETEDQRGEVTYLSDKWQS